MSLIAVIPAESKMYSLGYSVLVEISHTCISGKPVYVLSHFPLIFGFMSFNSVITLSPETQALFYGSEHLILRPTIPLRSYTLSSAIESVYNLLLDSTSTT